MFNDFRHQHSRARNQPAAGHVLRVAHQLVEVDFRGSHKGARATPALDDALEFQPGEGVARRHQTHLVGSGQFAFRSDDVARF